jgi:hypothetical protein
MTESVFSRETRLALHERYYPRGIWWLNSTGYEIHHHDPFPCRGAGDLIGAICGRWCEIELKMQKGRSREMQLVRQQACERLGLIYIEARELPRLFSIIDLYDIEGWIPDVQLIYQKRRVP